MDEIERKILERYEKLENQPSRYYTLLSKNEVVKYNKNESDDSVFIKVVPKQEVKNPFPTIKIKPFKCEKKYTPNNKKHPYMKKGFAFKCCDHKAETTTQQPKPDRNIKLKFISPEDCEDEKPKDNRNINELSIGVVESDQELANKFDIQEMKESVRHQNVSEVPLSEVVHYYKNCEFNYRWSGGLTVQRAKWYFINDSDIGGETADGEYVEVGDWQTSGQLKLFLRDPLSLNEQEREEYKNLCYRNYNSYGNLWRISDTPASLHWLFKNHVDAFDLIIRGLAIPKI